MKYLTHWAKSIPRDYWIILLTALLCHGLILLNDGVYWDGWEVYVRDNDYVERLFDDTGKGPHADYHQTIKDLPYTLTIYKVTNFLYIWLAGLLVYKICLLTRFFTPTDSLLISLISLAYPAYQVGFELIMGPSHFYYDFFVVGVWLTLLSKEAIGRRYWLLRTASIAALFLGFWLNSVLTYYPAAFGLFYLVDQRKHGYKLISLPNALRFALRHLDYVLVPLVFWAHKQIFYPTLAPTYNVVGLRTSIFYNFMEFFRSGATLFNDAVGLLFAMPIVLLIVALVIRFCYAPLFRRRQAEDDDLSGKAPPILVLLYGFGMLLLSLFAYASVDKYSTPYGWETRHFILISVPVGLMLVAAARLILGGIEVGGYKLRYLLLLFLIFAFGISLVSTYIRWQGRWVKDRSVIAKLEAMGDTYEDVTFFWIDDTFILGDLPFYHTEEWRSIFRYTWNHDPSTQGFAALNYPIINRLEDLSPDITSGCQAILTIRQGPRPYNFNDALGLTVRYFFFRFTGLGDMDTYLNDVTRVSVSRILAPQATHCARQQEYLAAAVGDHSFLEDTNWEIQKYRTDLIFYLRHLAETFTPNRIDSAFTFWGMNDLPMPTAVGMDRLLGQGLVQIAMQPAPEACTSPENHTLLRRLDFDVEYFKFYCGLASQPFEEELFRALAP